jgi:4-diphosphocytidyl-2-C-methyl-D-erythritol kinase
MITFPNAKINLGLKVTERRPDGYHNLETIFYPIPLNDILEVIVAEPFDFSSSGIDLESNPEDNLVMKAYRIFRQYYDISPVKIFLHKVIPPGAGLGGGSSDAASMLVILNNLFHTNLSTKELEKLASAVGADCPFFINNTPALATGTGTELAPVDLNLASFKIILVKPPVSVSTSLAYKMILPRQPAVPVWQIITEPVETWKDSLSNDFEIPVFKMFPEIGRIKVKLYEMGALYASMSGSGSAVYGIFREMPAGFADAFPGYLKYYLALTSIMD